MHRFTSSLNYCSQLQIVKKTNELQFVGIKRIDCGIVCYSIKNMCKSLIRNWLFPISIIVSYLLKWPLRVTIFYLMRQILLSYRWFGYSKTWWNTNCWIILLTWSPWVIDYVIVKILVIAFKEKKTGKKIVQFF